MANGFDPRTQARATASGLPRTGDIRTAPMDEGLRSYMLGIYNYMVSGVLLTGIVALLGAQSETLRQIMTGGGLLMWIVMLAPLGLVFAMSFGMQKFSTPTLKAMFFAYAGLVGLSLSAILWAYTGTSVASAFFATAGAFAGLSFWGYTTKKDLSGMGTFLIMGVIGLIIAMVINIFLQSSTMELVISAAGVLIFAGLTAWDTQKLKTIYAHVAGTEQMGKVMIMGALNLYLDFLNMFLFLLRFMGSRD